MAVVNVTEYRSNSESELSGDSQSATWIERRSFTVLVNDPVNDGPYTARTATGIPRKGDPHPLDFYMRCRRVRASPRQGSSLLYDVECEYERSFSGNDGNEGTNPLDEPAQIRWDSLSSTERIDVDVNGDPIANVNDEPLDPPLEIDVADLTLSVTRNLPTFDPLQIYLYTNAVNSDSFLGFPAGTARILKISAESVTTEDFEYYVRTIDIAFRPAPPDGTAAQAWHKRVLNQGFMEKILILTRAVDDNKEPTANPVLLDENGARITDPADAHFLFFEVYPSRPFSALGIL